MVGGGNKGRFIIEQHSPCYLHPSNGPGIMITVVVFNWSKYDLWERAVRMALKAKNKLGFIDGTITRPTVKENEEFSELNVWQMVTQCCAHRYSMWLI